MYKSDVEIEEAIQVKGIITKTQFKKYVSK